jgi:hypothetical protein
LQLKCICDSFFLFLQQAVKRNKYYIIQTWMLLLCFVAGQFMVYAHNHGDSVAVNRSAYHHRDIQPKQTVTENCQLCDAMHHNTMATGSLAYFAPVVITNYFYKAISHDLVSIKLIHSAGRSPPTV